MSPDARPRRQRGSLSVEEILDGAQTILDTDGLDALSMTRLAKEIGAGPMSLYAHVESKADLLVLLYRRIAEGTDLPTQATDEAWDAWLERSFLAMRAQTLKNPALGREALLLYATNAVLGPVGLRPGTRILEALTSAGFSPDEATQAYITVNGFHTGFVLWEINRFHTQSVDDYRRDYLRRLAEAPEPPSTLSWEMLGAITDTPIEERYLAALRAVITGIKTIRAT